MGLEQLANDRVNGMKTIERAKETLEKIVDGEGISDMLAQRSRFTLARACESTGDFSNAKKHFGLLIEKFPESAFADAAKRAIARVEDPKITEAFTSFTEWEDSGVAPGPAGGLPDAPSLDLGGAFDGVDVPVIQPNSGGGALETGAGDTPMEKEETEAGSEKKMEKETIDPIEPMEKKESVEPMESKTPTESTDPIEGSDSKVDEDLPPAPKSDDKSDK